MVGGSCFTQEWAAPRPLRSRDQHLPVAAMANSLGIAPLAGILGQSVSQMVESISGNWDRTNAMSPPASAEARRPRSQDGAATNAVGGQPLGRRSVGVLTDALLQRIWDRTNGCGRDARAPRMAPTNPVSEYGTCLGQVPFRRESCSRIARQL